MKKTLILLLAYANFATLGHAQVTGGKHAFEFLRVSNSPHVSALGGMTPAAMGQDVSFALQNPGLLSLADHNQLALSHNIYYAGISMNNLQYAYHVGPLNTDFALGVQYLNYGAFDQTDIYGNKLGAVNAVDYSINLSAARSYLEKWRYGATLKVAHSSLAERSALALLADVGVVYEDTQNLITVGVVAKNMGVVVKKYASENKQEPLPFDLQIGITKELKNVPLRIFAVAHHLYQWDIRYDNPEDVVKNYFFGANEEPEKEKSYFIDKFFRHFNFGGELILAKRVTVSGAYSHLRRSDLGYNESKGLAGFSFGLGVDLNKLHLRYGRSYYATAGAYNEIGLSLQLNKLFGIGSKTDTWGWDGPVKPAEQ